MKKANAVIALLSIALLVVHVVYQVYCYLHMYYNPVISAVLAYPFAGLVVLHAILGIVMLTKRHDERKKVHYKKANLRTMVQRISAFGILILLPVHIKTGDWIVHHTGGEGVLVVLVLAEILFWAMLFLHIATSFSKAWITLGFLSDRKKQRIVDGVVGVLCAAGFLFAAVVVIRTQFFLFHM